MRFQPAIRPLLLLAFASVALVHSAIAGELKFTSFELSREVYDRNVKPIFTKSCAKCHDEKTTEGELNLLMLDADMKASTSAARWVVVSEKLPPARCLPKQGRR